MLSHVFVYVHLILMIQIIQKLTPYIPINDGSTLAEFFSSNDIISLLGH
jgi:hypothetical protein